MSVACRVVVRSAAGAALQLRGVPAVHCKVASKCASMSSLGRRVDAVGGRHGSSSDRGGAPAAAPAGPAAVDAPSLAAGIDEQQQHGARPLSGDGSGTDAAQACTVVVKNLPFVTTDEEFAAGTAVVAPPGALSYAVLRTQAGASLGKG